MFEYGSYELPTSNSDFQGSMYSGLIKAALSQAYRTSSFEHVTIEKSPHRNAIVTKTFKEGALKIVQLPNQVVHAKQVPSTALFVD